MRKTIILEAPRITIGNEEYKLFWKFGSLSSIQKLEKQWKLKLLDYFQFNSLLNEDYHFPSSVSWKEWIRKFLKKHLKLILTKWWRGIGEENIKYYNWLIDKIINQEEWELLKWKKNKVTTQVLKYNEYKDFEFLLENLKKIELKEIIKDVSHLDINNERDLVEVEKTRIEKMQAVWIIDSIARMLELRTENWNFSQMFNRNVSSLDNLKAVREKVNWIYAIGNETENIEENPNKDLVWPREYYDVRLDKFFKHLFIAAANKVSWNNSIFRLMYHKIINYNEKTSIDKESLLNFLEFIWRLDFTLEFDIFDTSNSAWKFLSWEEVSDLFRSWINKQHWVYNWFLEYILPKIYKIVINEHCRRNNKAILNWEDSWLMYEIWQILERESEHTIYSNKSQLDIDTINIWEWLDIYTIWEGGHRMYYLSKNGKIIWEYRWIDYNNIAECDWKKYLNVNTINNKFAWVNIETWETAWWLFDATWEIEEWVDWDMVFRAWKNWKYMYISMKTGKPIWIVKNSRWEDIYWEFDEALDLFELKDWDKVFRIKVWIYENYISLRKNWPVTDEYLWNFVVSDLKDLPFWEKSFEARTYKICEYWGYPLEPSDNVYDFNARTWKPVSMTEIVEFEIRRRFSKLTWNTFNFLRK